jgi:transcriptional regulator with XRE-family HTH domain
MSFFCFSSIGNTVNLWRNKRMEEINKQIGKRIQKLRMQVKLTQLQLSEQLKCSTSFLSRIERGVETGSIKFFVKVANILDVPLKNIFDFGEVEREEKIEEIVIRVRDKDGDTVDRVLSVNEVPKT